MRTLPAFKAPVAPASLRTGTALTTAFLCLGAKSAVAETTEQGPIRLPTATIEGQGSPASTGFKVEQADSPKYTAPLLDTPKSVTVIPAEMIKSTASASLTEALRTVPGITFGAGEGGNPVGDRPFLRGYDTQASTFVDGLRDIGAQSREVFNVESVEVAKGPSGAYGGRGSAGGSLNLISKTPKAENALSFSAGLGTAGYKRGTVDGNYVLSDSVAIRLNAMAHDSDVAGRDEVHQSRWGVAPSITLGLGKPTRATISYYHLQSDDLPDTGIPYNNPTFNARTDGRPRILLPGDGSAVKVNRDTFYGLVNRDFRRDKADVGTVRIEHDFSDTLTLRNTTRYSKTSQDYIWTQPDDSQGNLYYGMVWRRTNTRVSDVDALINQTDLYGKFSTGAFKHSFSVGLEFSREESENDSYTVATGSNRCPAGPGAAGGYNCTDLFHPNPKDPWTGSIVRNNNPSNSKTTTKSLYAFDTIELTPQIQLNLGLRLDKYSAKLLSAIDTNATTGTPARPNPRFGKRTEFSRDDTLVNYQAGLVYKPVSNASLYVSYATSSTPTGSFLAQGSDGQGFGFDRSGNPNGNEQLAPEKNRAFELGAKWDVLNERLSLTASIFRVETTNARVVLQDGTSAMVGKKRVDGAEIGVAGKLTDQWQIFSGYTYLDAKLVKNGGAGAAFGLTDGATFPNTPKNSISLWTTYDVLPNLTIGGGAFYMSKVWGSQPSNKWVPSYWRFDAMAAYRINDRFDLQLNVQNLTDKTYYDKAYPTHYVSVAPGRSAVLTLNAKL